jgi:pyruvate/2-oxoglutarate dehydrogenase complex dihydrolipoamide dehydrogenase (E3) component
MNPQHFDILVIGSGPGGEGAAMQAQDFDKTRTSSSLKRSNALSVVTN